MSGDSAVIAGIAQTFFDLCGVEAPTHMPGFPSVRRRMARATTSPGTTARLGAGAPGFQTKPNRV